MADNKKFLDITGLTYFYNKLKGVFAPQKLMGYSTSTGTNTQLRVNQNDTPATGIGKLEKAIIDNEKVFTNATESIANSVGLNETLKFIPSADSEYAGATNIVNAIDIISVAMNSRITTLQSKVNTLEQQVSILEPPIDGITKGTGNKSIILNSGKSTTGSNSLIMGFNTQNKQQYAFVGGDSCVNNSVSSNGPNIIFGDTIKITSTNAYSNALFGKNITVSADINYSLFSGYGHTYTGTGSILSGYYNEGSGIYSNVFGWHNLNNSDYSLVGGYYCNNNSNYSIIAGKYNSGKTSVVMELGYGTSASSKKNVFRITTGGSVYGTGAYNSSGADYAEMFEWEDGNPDSEDRVGYFVTLKGDKISIAKSTDMIIGIVSGTANIIGNNPEDWYGREKRDNFGRRIFEEKIDEVTGKKELLPVDSEDYDSSKEYIPRENRKEWSAIGLIGQLRVRQDGTLSVGDKCACNDQGIATKTTKTTKAWYVMKVINPEIVQILFK